MEFSFIFDSKLEAKILAWFEKHKHECESIGLATQPESTHYHIKKVKEKGTLELTVSPANEDGSSEYLFQMRANRYAAWGAETVENILQKFDLEA